MFELVRPLESHARLIMEWRNDPLTRAMSRHMRPKVFDSFYREFLSDYVANPHLPALFILFQGERAGLVRLTLPGDKGSVEVSILVAPSFRRKGIALKALQNIQEWVRAQGFWWMRAEIREENSASLDLFHKAGFKIEGRIERRDEEGRPFPLALLNLPLVEPPATKSHVFIVGEIGSNFRSGKPDHKKDLERARALIDVAAQAGADAVKFQLFRSSELYAAHAGKSSYLKEAGIEEDISELLASLEFPEEFLTELALYTRQKGIEWMCTPFSLQAFDLVDPLVQRHKIASYELTFTPLIEAAAKSKKPLFLSTGAATVEEIEWAVKTYREAGGEALTLLHCTAAYPAPDRALNLQSIPFLRECFALPVGLSDHSMGLEAPLMAVALGATALEKHITLSRSLKGPDHAFAMEPLEFKEMVRAIRRAEEMLGHFGKEVEPEEEELRLFAQRRLQTTSPVGVGTPFSFHNTAILRPGNQSAGIHPKFLPLLLGKAALRLKREGEGIQFGDF